MVSTVLVVGAGPSGLATALSLAKHGVSVKVIEKRAKGDRVGSRGTSIQPRTIELLALLGLPYADLLQSGTPPLEMRAYVPPEGITPARTWPWSEVSEPDPTVPYPDPVTISQAVLERKIEALLLQNGVEIDFSCTLTDLRVFPDRMEAVVTNEGDGNPERILTVDWVVGADGARGAVRHILGVQLLGESRPAERMFIADVRIPGFEQGYWHMWGKFDQAAVGLKPLGGDLFQLQALGPQIDFTTLRTPSEIAEAFWKISGRKDIVFHEIQWMTEFRANIRLVDRLRVDRCFLVGDAGHCHSPAGGQGLNTSVQDAFNLGWKLSLACRGIASDILLDAYESERLPILAEMLQLSTALHDRLFSKASEKGDPMYRPKHLQQLGINYRFSPIIFDERDEAAKSEIGSDSPYGVYRSEGSLKAGDRTPDTPGHLQDKPSSIFDLLRAGKHTALVFCPGRHMHDQSAVRTLLASIQPYADAGIIDVVAVVPKDSETSEAPECTIFFDTQGVAFKAYHVEVTPAVFIVRPDMIIGGIATSSDGIGKYFEKITTGAH